MGLILEFKVPVLPPSVNSLYGINARGSSVRMFLKPEGRRFKEQAKLFMPFKKFEEEERFFLHTEVHARWRCKNGSSRKLDVMNLDKIVCDAVAEKYFDAEDERIWKRLIEKVESEEEFLFIRLFSVTD